MISTQGAHTGIAKSGGCQKALSASFPFLVKTALESYFTHGFFQILFKPLSTVLCTQQALRSLNEWVNSKGVRVISKIPSHSCFLWLLTAVKGGPNAYLQRSPNYFLFLHPGRQNMPQVDLEQFLLTTGYIVKQLKRILFFAELKGRGLHMKKTKVMSLQLWSANVWKMGTI